MLATLTSIVSTMAAEFGMLFYIVPPPQQSYFELAMQDVPDYSLSAVKFFFVLAIAEYLHARAYGQTRYNVKDSIASVSSAGVMKSVGVFSRSLSVVPYLYVYYACAPLRRALMPDLLGGLDTRTSNWILYVCGMLACDFAYYAMHRTAHEWHLLWIAHSNHHSGERYNTLTALRQGAFQGFYSWLFYLPFAALGLPPSAQSQHNQLNTLYQFWIHNESIGRLPWLVELVMNTASHHRSHHRPPGNCNYAGVLIIWDRLFGTFFSEYELCKFNDPAGKPPVVSLATAAADGDDTAARKSGVLPYRSVVYGLAKPVGTFDPLWPNVQHLFRISSSGAEPNAQTLTDKVKRGLFMCTQRRVQTRYRIETSLEKLIPDILVQWRYGKRAGAVFELPPNSETETLNGQDDTSKQGPYNATDRKLTKRETEFLQGRAVREGTDVAGWKLALVCIHFVVAFACTYAFIYMGGKVGLEDMSMLAWERWAFMSAWVACAALLWSVQLHYES